MRIAYVVPRYLPHLGGVETHVAALASRARSAGCAVEVLTRADEPKASAIELVDGMTVRRFGADDGSRSRPELDLALYLARNRGRYDLVHAHNYHAVFSLAASAVRGTPLVFTPHYLGTGDSLRLRAMHSLYRRFGRRIFRASSRVVCVSDAEAELVRAHFPEAATRVTVIPNGVDVVRIGEAEPFRIDGETVLCAGRLEDYKNVQVAVAALAHLGDAFNLKVAGEGPARRALEQLAARAGVSGRVEFLGQLDRASLARWLRSARVFVTMSNRECFGITLLEALAAGTRAVAADIPVHREVAQRARGGEVEFVHPRASAAEVARAIEYLAARPGPPSDASPPSWDAVAEETLSVYRAVAGVEPAGRGD